MPVVRFLTVLVSLSVSYRTHAERVKLDRVDESLADAVALNASLNGSYAQGQAPQKCLGSYCSKAGKIWRVPSVLNMYHHNPHWECFEDITEKSGVCRKGAWKEITRRLLAQNVDFASLVMAGKYRAPDGFLSLSHTSGFDQASIVWNADRWKLEDEYHGDFEQGRAVAAARFHHVKFTGFRVVVVSAHYPHHKGRGWERVKLGIIKKLTHNRATKLPVIVMADTNTNHHATSSDELLNGLGALGLDGMLSTEDRKTCCCCTPRRKFEHSFDRIMTNFGMKLETTDDREYVSMTNNYLTAPWWAKVSKELGGTVAAYHHPISGRLTLHY